MKVETKKENKKWLFLGSAILLATVVIAVILNLPSKNTTIDGSGLNATVISNNSTVTLTKQTITNSQTNNYTVTRADKLYLNKTKEGNPYYSPNLITKYTTNGQIVYCIELGTVVNLGSDNTRKATSSSSSNYWNELTQQQRDDMSKVLLYGYPNNSSLSGSDDDKYVATQILIWEIQQGWRTKFNASNPEPDKMTDANTKKIVYTKWVANDADVKKVYEQIVKAVSTHSDAPDSKSVELTKSGNSYTATVSGNYSGFTCSDAGTVTCRVNSDGTVTLTSPSRLSISTRVTLTKQLPSSNAQGMLILEHAQNQRMIVGKPEFSVTTTITATTEVLGSITIAKTSDDRSTQEFEFEVTGPNNYKQIVKVNGQSQKKLEGLELGTYRVKEINVPDKYILLTDELVLKLSKIVPNQHAPFVNILKNTTSVRVAKVDAESGDMIKGAKMVVKNAVGVEVHNWVSTEDWYLVPNDILKTWVVGEEYKVCEKEAPAGYVKTENCETFKLKDKSDSVEIKFKNAKKETEILISKQDSETGKEIGGAKLQLIKPDGEVVEWTTKDNESKLIKGLVIGETYTIKELEAPAGYSMAKEKDFVFKTSGEKIVITNKKISVEISKQDATTSKEIAGAHLQIKNSKGEVVDEWVSEEGKNHIFKDYKNGGNIIYGETYTLTETIAPDGYALTESIRFVAGKDTKVIMKNKMTEVIVKKVDTVSKKRVAGAHLQLLDEKGNVLKEWDTTDSDYVITGLLTGKQYKIKETKVPKNYLQAEVVSFSLGVKESSKEVIVNNTPIVYVEDTAADTNTIMIIIGALIAVGGIGSIIWIKKRSA